MERLSDIDQIIDDYVEESEGVPPLGKRVLQIFERY